MYNFNQQFPNLQQLQYMEQQQRMSNQQIQPHQMDGPSFTGEASVFQQRQLEADHEERNRRKSQRSRSRERSYGRSRSYNRSRSRSRDRSEEREYRRRSKSRGRTRSQERDDIDRHHRSRRRSGSSSRGGGEGDPERKLHNTLKRLQQLEEQQRMQDQLLKDVQVQLLEDQPTNMRRNDFPRNEAMTDPLQTLRGGGGPQLGSSFDSQRSDRWNSTYSWASESASSKGTGIGPPTCFVCQKEGHKSFDCPSKTGSDARTCYVCGKKGHKSFDCPSKTDKEEESDHRTDTNCFWCHKYGHVKAQCPDLGVYGPRKSDKEAADHLIDKKCFKCQRFGHIQTKCPDVYVIPRKLESEVKCFVCRKDGHKSYHCPEKTSEETCFKCQKPGHKAYECPQLASPSPRRSQALQSTDREDIVCHKCRKTGHKQFQCESSLPRSGGETACFKCQKPGHKAYECPQLASPSSRRSQALPSEYTFKSGTYREDIVCHKCKKTGHKQYQCEEFNRPTAIKSSAPRSARVRCFKCNGYGHFARECQTIGEAEDLKASAQDSKDTDKKSLKAKVRCFKCNGYGHIARECQTIGEAEDLKAPAQDSKDTDKKSLKETSKSSPERIDQETAVMINAVLDLAKTKYPVPEGCLTRLEIDDMLKRTGNDHQVLDKDIPAPPAQTQTTLFNQIKILDKLWWKDMLYDRVVENLYCLICQKGSKDMQAYQDHVNYKDHRNFNTTLLGIKTGWAVRTKLLKKICSLPSIFEEPPSGQDKKPYPDIKPELLTDTTTKKFFVCRVCQSWGETPLQSHFESERHKFLYENQWKCDVCNAYFRSYKSFKQHADSRMHKQVMAKTIQPNDASYLFKRKKGMSESSSSADEENDDTTSTTRKRSLEPTDKPTAAKKSRYSTRSSTKGEDLVELMFSSDDSPGGIIVDQSQIAAEKEPSESTRKDTTEPTPRSSNKEDLEASLGYQFLVPVTGFYCKLCSKFYNEAKMTRKEHCYTVVHRAKVKKWYKQNARSLLKPTNPSPAVGTTTDEGGAGAVDSSKMKENDGNSTDEGTSKFVVIDEVSGDEEKALERENVDKTSKEGAPSSNEEKPADDEDVPDDENETGNSTADETPKQAGDGDGPGGQNQVIDTIADETPDDDETSVVASFVLSDVGADNVEVLQQVQEDQDVDIEGNNAVEADACLEGQDKADVESKMDVDANESVGSVSELESKKPDKESTAYSVENIGDETDFVDIEDSDEDDILSSVDNGNKIDTDKPLMVPQIKVERVDPDRDTKDDDQISKEGKDAPGEDAADEDKEKPSCSEASETSKTSDVEEKPAVGEETPQRQTRSGSRVTRSKATSKSPKKGRKSNQTKL